MQKIFDSLKWIMGGILAPITIVLGAIANPQGAVNGFLCRMIDLVAFVWPSTPEPLKISSLLQGIGSAIPVVGYAVVLDVFQTAATMFAIVVAIKIYKLIPFKMT